MLDDLNVLSQRDPSGALEIASNQYEQTNYFVEIINKEHDHRIIKNIVVAGMGGSALAALLAKTWLKSELTLPIEIVRTYNLPSYVGNDTLVIASSYSGNTEETLNCLAEATARGAQTAIIASGGKLIDIANEKQIAAVTLPSHLQPRMAVIYNLRALIELLVNFEIINESKLDEIKETSDWLKNESSRWSGDKLTSDNYAKQLALKAVGKTAIFYGGTITAPVAYKWKISWNENAKNLAFWNEYPELDHNEFMGWSSHPVEKPFAVFDIISNLEHPQILKRFELSDRLLSGMMPKSTRINLSGNTIIEQLLWGSILADFVSIYVAILNGVDATPVKLIESLKKELA